jgi:hypothetical protein
LHSDDPGARCRRRHVTVTTPGGIAYPHAEQAIRITRTRTTTRNGKTTRETAYLTISLPTAGAHPT